MLNITENRVRVNVIENVVHLSVEKTIVKAVNVGNVMLIKEGGGTYQEEALAGAIDGINKTFSTTQNFVTGSTWVFVNGLKQRLNLDYMESGNNLIVFDEAPSNTGFDDDLKIIYRIS